MANVTVTIRTEDSVAAAIDGVDVQIFDAAGTVFITSGTTGTPPGEIDFLLLGDGPGVTYTVRLFKTGVSFLPQPEFSIVVTDPPNPNNFFTFVGTLGLQGVVAKLVTQDDTLPTPNPVAAVRVRLFDAGDLFLTEFDTDAGGEAELVLTGAVSPGLQYIVRLSKAGLVLQDGPTQTISVIDPLGGGETNIFDFVLLAQPGVSVSSDPDMCRLSGFFVDPSLRPLKNVVLIFHPREGYPDFVVAGAPFSGEPTVVRNLIIASDRRVNTDKNGFVEIDLPREGIFDVFIQGLDAANETLLAPIFIPDIAGIGIQDVLFPFITTVTYDTGAVAVDVEETVELVLTLASSNLQPVEGRDAVVNLFDFTVDDDEVALVEVNNDGNLDIKGLAVGVVTLSVVRHQGTAAPRRPALPAIITLPSEPIVTVT